MRVPIASLVLLVLVAIAGCGKGRQAAPPPQVAKQPEPAETPQEPANGGAELIRPLRNPDQAKRRAEAEVEQQLASVARLERDTGGRVQRVTFHEAATDADLAVLSKLPSVKAVGLADAQISDAALDVLAKLGQLEELDLAGTAITDDGLRRLLPLKQLQVLKLTGTRITGSGLEPLSQLPALRSLDLAWTRIDDGDAEQLAEFQQLARLDVSFTSLSDAAIDALKRLTSLESLTLDGTDVSNEGLDELAGSIPGLKPSQPAASPQPTPTAGRIAVDSPAPEIEGEDLDGVVFKLSDYRGKVVVLDFWGHW